MKDKTVGLRSKGAKGVPPHLAALVERQAMYNGGGTSNYVTNYVTQAISEIDTGLHNVVEDLSPELGGDLDAQNHNISNISITKFTPIGTPPAHAEGVIFYDDANHCLTSYNDQSEVAHQHGRELWARCVNTSLTEDIPNGSFVRVSGAFSGVRTIELAIANDPITASGLIGMATQDIPKAVPDGGGGYIYSEGEVTTFGSVGGLDTSLCTEGDRIYLSDSVRGGWTKTPPNNPSYKIEGGSIEYVHATEGKISVHIVGRPEDIFDNGWNGSIQETLYFSVSSPDGIAVTGSLERDGGGDLTLRFSDGFHRVDTSPAIEIALTPGTDSDPQKNYVYFLKTTKTLTLSTSNWPSEEHARVAYVVLRSALATQTEGAFVNQNLNDHVAGNDGVGHILHIARKLRLKPPDHESGTEGTLTIVSASTPDDLFVATTSGVVSQLHSQIFPALDMATGDDIHVTNSYDVGLAKAILKTTDNLNTELLDGVGGSLSGRYYSIVVWGIANRTGETSHLMANMPIGSYNSSELAISDPYNYSVYTMLSYARSVAFPIARFTVRHSPAGGGTWTLEATEDLTNPDPTSAGGGGGGGVSTFAALTDTPSSSIGFAGYVTAVNSAETGLEYVQRLSSVVEDTTPQLGGPLDAQENNINNVGDITHSDATASSWAFINENLDQPIMFSINNGGVQTNAICIDGQNKRVGVLVDMPQADLELESDNANNARGLMISQYNDSASTGLMQFRQGRGTRESPAALQVADRIGLFRSNGYDGSGWVQSAFFGFRVDDTVSTGVVPAGLVFGTGSTNFGTERMRILSSGEVGINTSTPTATLDVNADVIRLRTSKTPSSATDTGNAGDIAWDSNYIYVCVATNTWKRSQLTSW